MRNKRYNRNNLIIIALCLVLVLMGVGYASFSTLLNINGTASISNSWCVGFDNTKTTDYTAKAGIVSGNAPTGSISFSGNTCSTNYQPNATITANFKQPGDEITYTLTIKNKSTVKAVINSIEVDGEEVTSNTTKIKDNIVYKINMPLSTSLEPEEETTMTVEAKFQDYIDITEAYKGESKTINVNINIEQGNQGFTPVDDLYTLTYNYTENGGTKTNETSNFEYYDDVDLTKIGIKEGYTFVGWNTDKNAHVGLKKYKMPKENKTLYAIYKKDITITYEKDNGVGSLSKDSDEFTIYNNETHQVNLPVMTLKNDNYSINGYYKDDVFIGNDNEPYTFNNSATVKAQTISLPVMRSYSSFIGTNGIWNEDTPDYHNDSVRETITNIEFIDIDNTSLTVPTQINNVTVWDVSEEQNESVIAWTVENGNTKTLYIGGKGGVIGNVDSSFLFSKFTNVKTINFNNNFDTTKVETMVVMFNDCINLEQLNLESFNTSKVKGMTTMFNNCSSLTEIDLGDNFNTSNVTTMLQMFGGCSSLTELDLGGKFDTSNVIYMSNMFNNCSSLTELDLGNKFDTSNVVNMSQMFNNCSSLTELDLGDKFDTSNVTSMIQMFQYCSSLTELDLGEIFDTNNVINMRGMFTRCSSLTELDLGDKFDTTHVEYMNGMFQNCTNLKSINFGNKFSTINVKSLNYMFGNCSSLIELDLSTFDTRNTIIMNGFVSGCSNLLTIYASDKFTTNNVTDSANMFSSTTKLIGGNGTAVSVKKVYDKTYALIDEEGQEGYFTSYLQPKIATVTTTNSIKVVVTMDSSYGSITKYEFSKDDGATWIDNGTNNLYTFTSLTKNAAYPIVVRVTDENNETYTSYKRNVTTKTFNAATFKQINNSETSIDIKITFPSGCGDNLTCTYSKNSGENVNVTETEVTLNFSEIGNITTSVTDGNNIVGSTYTISGMPTRITKNGLSLLVAKQGDGLYDNDDSSYSYKGANPNNYIELNGEAWRIMSFNSDGTIKVIRDASIGTKTFDPGYATAITGITSKSSVVGTRYSSSAEDYCNAAETSYAGCKVWGSKNTMRDSNGNLLLDTQTNTAKMPRVTGNATTYNLPEDESYLNVYLNGGTYGGVNVTSWYEAWSQTLPANESSKILTNHLWNVGLVGYTKNQKFATDITQEKAYTWQGTVGLMSAVEYVRASTNTACAGVYNYRATSGCYSSGATHNYLFKSENGWTITPLSGAAVNQAWGPSSTYIYYNRSVVSAYNVRPALYLSSSTVLTGDGTIDNKYKIS